MFIPKITFNYYLLLLLFLFSACQGNTDTATNTDRTAADPTENARPIKPNPVNQVGRLIVEVDKLRLREEGSGTGAVIDHLKKGAMLTDLNEISVASQTITIRGVKYTEPWIKVRTAEGKEGWVFGGAVNYEGISAASGALKMRTRKLNTLFGKELTQRILAYGARYRNVNTEVEMASLYQDGTVLRDTLITYLTDRIVYTNEESSPDLFWLDKMLPGFTVQLAAEGTVYYFFWNYKKLADKAKITIGKVDDDFMGLALEVHSVDSIEHFYPSWFLQTWDYGGNSLLGQGKHEKILAQMDEIYQPEGLFAKEILALKRRLVDDITNPQLEYWESQDKILEELDRIIAADFKILNQQDKIALSTRRKQFADYKKNKIKLNVRAGMS